MEVRCDLQEALPWWGAVVHVGTRELDAYAVLLSPYPSVIGL